MNHASHFRKYSRKRMTSFEVVTLGNGVELPEGDYTCLKEKKKGIFVKALWDYF